MGWGNHHASYDERWSPEQYRAFYEEQAEYQQGRLLRLIYEEYIRSPPWTMTRIWWEGRGKVL